MKSRGKRLLALLFIALLFVMPIAGCGTTVDNSSQEQEKGDDWMEEEKKEEIKEEIKRKIKK